MRFRLDNVKSGDLIKLPDDEFKRLVGQVLSLQQADRRENNLVYYRPVSDTARKIHLSKAKTVGVGGGNGCLPLDAPVLMADASWKPLGDVVVGDMVIAADPVTGKAVPAPVTHVWRSGKQPVYRIEYSDGGSFEATASHRVPMYLGSGKKTSKGNDKRPHKRILGDYIEPILRRGDANPSKRISCVSPSDIQFEQKEPTISPYLLGSLLGDGSLGKKSLKFSNADNGVIDRIKEIVDSENCNLVKYQGYDYGISSRNVRSNNLIDKIRSLGLWGCNSYTKFIPRECFGWSRSDRMELLAGLVDTDGGLNSYSSCSYVLANDFCMLVRSLGGKATMAARSSLCQNGVSVDYYCVYWRLIEKLPLSLLRKQADSQRGREIDYCRRVCRSARLSRVAECGDIEVGHPSHCYVTKDFTIVSNSSKTESCLVEMLICATGVVPLSLKDDIDMAKFRGPMNCRVVCQSLTTVLHPIILPKLQWWKWTGVDVPGGEKGHWGWIPKTCLIDGSWERSWSEKLRLLRVLYRNPNNINEVLGESTIQFMSHDQDPFDFASGDFHFILHDEPPKYATWRENQARTMRVNGRNFLAMTWPDDPAIPVDWIFDEVYDKAQEGPNKDPNIDWFNLYTTDNRNLNQEAVAAQAGSWSEEVRKVRIFGQPIRFSNRIHPLFTDTCNWWCFKCAKQIMPVEERCLCGSSDIVEYNHVREFDVNPSWPTAFILDPHPRKPHMFMWVQIDPSDDLWVVAEGELAEEPDNVKELTDSVERGMSLGVKLRLIDPNMGRSVSGIRREISWQDEFSLSGLHCDLADDSDVGRSRINEYLKPDKATKRPRITIHPRCKNTIFQMKRYAWDEHRSSLEKDLKQKAKMKYDDYPTMLKYLQNYEPTFRMLLTGGPVIVRHGKRSGAY